MANQCKFWDCFEKISPVHTFCGDHFEWAQAGDIDDCPLCDRGKFSKYPLCTDCETKSSESIKTDNTKLATIHLLSVVNDLMTMVNSDTAGWPDEKLRQLDRLEHAANMVRRELQSG